MTEKRYTIKPQDDLFGVVDNYSVDKVCVINGIRTEIEAKWLCKDMNVLNVENEMLKSRIEHLERKIQRERTSAMKQHEKWESEIQKENKQLQSDLEDCKRLKKKRLNKIRNHRAVIEDLGGSIRAYKGKIGQANEKIEKIKEAMEDTGALTKRQLEEILND